MILISLCYGKQTQIVEDRAKKAKDVTADNGTFTGPAFEPEILLADFEHPKHLTVYDLGLADADKAWHSHYMSSAPSDASRTSASETLKPSTGEEVD